MQCARKTGKHLKIASFSRDFIKFGRRFTDRIRNEKKIIVVFEREHLAQNYFPDKFEFFRFFAKNAIKESFFFKHFGIGMK